MTTNEDLAYEAHQIRLTLELIEVAISNLGYHLEGISETLKKVQVKADEQENAEQ